MYFNTKECEWADVNLFINGQKVVGLRSLSYGVNPNKESVYAAGKKPFSIQSGNHEYTGEVKILKNDFDRINAGARASGFDDLNDLEFMLVVTYASKGSRELKTDTLYGCQFNGYTKAIEQGAKYMEITLPILFLDVKAA